MDSHRGLPGSVSAAAPPPPPGSSVALLQIGARVSDESFAPITLPKRNSSSGAKRCLGVTKTTHPTPPQLRGQAQWGEQQHQALYAKGTPCQLSPSPGARKSVPRQRPSVPAPRFSGPALPALVGCSVQGQVQNEAEQGPGSASC